MYQHESLQVKSVPGKNVFSAAGAVRPASLLRPARDCHRAGFQGRASPKRGDRAIFKRGGLPLRTGRPDTRRKAERVDADVRWPLGALQELCPPVGAALPEDPDIACFEDQLRRTDAWIERYAGRIPTEVYENKVDGWWTLCGVDAAHDGRKEPTEALEGGTHETGEKNVDGN